MLKIYKMIIYKGHKINDVKLAVENITATTPSCNLEEIRITSNGTYLPKQGVDGYNKVVVNVPNSGGSGSGEYDILECTELTITASDVEYNQTTTMINYTATCNCKDNTGGQTTTCKLFGTVTSEDFGINTTQENRLITISFTYKNKTATTQIIQGYNNDIENYTFAFEFVNANSIDYKLNKKQYTADHSPFSVNIKDDLGIAKLTDTSYLFPQKADLVTKIITLPNCRNVTNMAKMFCDCKSLTSLDLSKLDTSNVTNMYNMFGSCDGLTSLDLSKLDTSNVIYMTYMFNDCSSLTSLDLSKLDTSNVTDISNMFRFCSSLTSLDLSHFNTSNVTDMSYMFNGCSSLTTLDLHIFNTSKVTDMDNMFQNCEKITSLDLSNFDVSNITKISNIFYNCYSLTNLDLSNWAIPYNIGSQGDLFIGCKALKTIYMRNCLPTTINYIKSQLSRVQLLDKVTIITE